MFRSIYLFPEMVTFLLASFHISHKSFSCPAYKLIRKRPRTVREREEADALLEADPLLEALADEHMDMAQQLM